MLQEGLVLFFAIRQMYLHISWSVLEIGYGINKNLTLNTVKNPNNVI